MKKIKTKEAMPRRSFRLKKETAGFLFVLPWVAGFLIFTLGPCIYTLVVSFLKWNLMSEPEFAGLKNYRNLLDDDLFLQSLAVTFRFVAVSVTISLFFSLGIALLLNVNHKIMYLYRTIFYIPSVVSGIAVAIVWSWIFSKDFGVLNYVLSLVGIKGPNWLGDPRFAPWAFVIIMSITYIGGPMIIFIAGLQNIPVYLYEAASLDGANGFQKLVSISLPSLSPIILYNLVTMIIGAFRTFVQAYTLAGKYGDPNHSLLFVVMHIYNKAFSSMEFGSSAAMSWVFIIIVLAISLIVMRMALPHVHYEDGE